MLGLFFWEFLAHVFALLIDDCTGLCQPTLNKNPV